MQLKDALRDRYTISMAYQGSYGVVYGNLALREINFQPSVI